MKHSIRNTTILAALILGSLSASLAETVNVPFAFQAGGAAFPAGQYEVSDRSSHAFLYLQSKQYPAKQFTWVAHPGDANAQSDTVLSFDKSGSVPVLLGIQNQQWRTNNFSTSLKKNADPAQASLGR